MRKYKLVDNVVGWIVFIIASATYLMTIEPTASFWDCSEFIATAYKFDVGHPPGAPFFMLIAKIFTYFASSADKVAKMVNSMSALFSALTILFLFWTITHLVKKIVIKDENNITLPQIITIMGCGVVGALAYTFSDTFWFSAVEGEVYAFSSLFTAGVVWCMLKWEDSADKPNSDRWIIFIAYLIGLSVGVHLLNLLCVPALVLIYYFKKAKNVTVKGSLLAFVFSGILVGILLYGIVPGFVNMAGWFDLFFVNVVGLPFNSGCLVFVALVLALIAWGLYETGKENNDFRIKLSFSISVIVSGIPFYGENPLVWLLLCAIIVAVTFMWKKFNPRIFNTMLICLLVMLIGYSSYGVIVIRSMAQPPMDENSPRNMFSLESYLNREQYGERPLFYGQTFVSDYSYKPNGRNCVPVYKRGGKIWAEEPHDNGEGKDKYISPGYKQIPVMTPETNMFFPRMFSKSTSPGPDHISQYKMWSDFKGKSVTVDRCGRKEKVLMPTMAENLRFFFRYQLNFMYWRYFMWNFSGRQNDIQCRGGELENGNWITGFNFIDKHLVGDQTNLPSTMDNNKGHNKYYMLPLLLGLIGIFIQLYSNKKGVQGFWITFLLFFMTGIAIVIYLNQTPLQPRERDYAYAGSFYAFAIWIGFGVAGVVKLLRKIMPELPSSIIASLLCLCVPILMACQNWDDHDRSNRYTCRDVAYNYLMSCDKNAVIFTNGDNDTFPLWYLQDVEGVRTDVRVCNLSYLQTDWYISQMQRPYYKSAALPIGWPKSKYMNSKRDVARIIPLTDSSISVGEAMDWFLSDDPRKKRVRGFSGSVDYLPAEKLYIKVDKEKVEKSGYVPAIYDKYIVDSLNINLKGRSYLGKQSLAILSMLNNNKWQRPIYFAATVDDNQFLGLKGSMIQEGLAYKVSPVKFPGNNLKRNYDKMYDLYMNKYRWGNMKDPDVYMDENNQRTARIQRYFMLQFADDMASDSSNFTKVRNILTKCREEIPFKCIPPTFRSAIMGRAYYKIGEKDSAREVLSYIVDDAVENFNWLNGLTDSQYASAYALASQSLYTFREALTIFNKYDPDMVKKYSMDYQRAVQRLSRYK